MIDTPVPTQRITCSEPSPNNPYGRSKLLATIVPEGVQTWCKYCRQPHLITREQCIAAWERGESAIACTPPLQR